MLVQNEDGSITRTGLPDAFLKAMNMKTKHEYLIAIRVRTNKPIGALADVASSRVETIYGVEGPVEVLSFLEVKEPKGVIQVAFSTAPKALVEDAPKISWPFPK